MTILDACFNQASIVKLLARFVSITSIEKPTADVTHVTPNIRFESDKVSHKSDK